MSPIVALIQVVTSLRELDLNEDKVTDAGLEHLKGLVHLQSLDLSSNNVTDSGLAHLKGLAGLHELGLCDTQVTAEGVKSIKRALPKCSIDWRKWRIDRQGHWSFTEE